MLLNYCLKVESKYKGKEGYLYVSQTQKSSIIILILSHLIRHGMEIFVPKGMWVYTRFVGKSKP